MLLFSSDEEEEEEEEMLISEEEIPFKDDPRDETYKPHLERHVSGLLVKNKLGKHFCMLLFHLVAKLMDMDLIFKGVILHLFYKPSIILLLPATARSSVCRTLFCSYSNYYDICLF